MILSLCNVRGEENDSEATRQKEAADRIDAYLYMDRVISTMKKTDLRLKPQFSYTTYHNMKVAINDLNPLDTKRKLFRRFTWLKDFVEECGLNGKFILPLLTEEKVTEELWLGKPEKQRTVVTGLRNSGLNEIFNTGDVVNVMIGDNFTDINLYDDRIRFLSKRFISPISHDALDYYFYWITNVTDSTCTVKFEPRDEYLVGFSGELEIMRDSSMQVRHVHLSLPKYSIVNFIDNLHVEQRFARLNNGEWAMNVNNVMAEMSVVGNLGKLCYVKEKKFSNFNFDTIDSTLFARKDRERIEPKAEYRDSTFWMKYYTDDGRVYSGEHEDIVKRILRYAYDIKPLRPVVWTTRAFIDNYIETGTPSKFDIGPVTSLISFNDIDGLRLRFGGQTTGQLNRHLFVSGYIAHGFKGDRYYYQAKTYYSFNQKKYGPEEYPRRYISFSSAYDVCSPNDRNILTDKDNIFRSYKWNRDHKMLFCHEQIVDAVRDQDNGFRFLARLKFTHDEAMGDLFFRSLSKYGEGVYHGGTWQQYYDIGDKQLHNGSIRTTQLHLQVEYSPGAKYYNTKRRQLPVNNELPVMSLSHTFGFKDLMGGQYSFNMTELKAYKRFFLDEWGFTNIMLKGAIQWNQVPYPLLIAPTSNLSYVSSEDAFYLLNTNEFLNDRYVQAMWSMETNGVLFSRLPYIRRLKLREYLAVHTLWGTLSNKNNPNLEQNWTSNILMAFPEGYYVMNSRRPYVEGVIGIHNILHFFNVDFAYRFNYLTLPTARRTGVRFSARFSF